MTKQILYIDDDCFRHQKFLIKLLGFSTNKKICYNFYGIALIILPTLYLFLEINEIPKQDDFNNFVYNMLFIIGYITGLSIKCNMALNRARLRSIFIQVQRLKMMSNLLLENKNPILEKYEHRIKRQSYIGTGLIVFLLASLISIAMIVSRKNEKWTYPFGIGANFNNTNLELLFQSIFYCTIGTAFLTMIVIQLNLLLLVSCHCKILHNCIKKILDNSYKALLQTGKYLVEKESVPWSFIKPQLILVVEYHVGIIELATEIERIFNFVSLAVFSGMGSVLCIGIYHMLSLPVINGNVLHDIVLIFIAYFSMTVPSIRGQQVITESEKIIEACCTVDFSGTDIRFQKALMMIIITSQKPIALTAGKIKILCLTTMVGVLRTSYTFYTFLRNM